MRVISARFAPLPPSSGFIEPSPSAFLLPHGLGEADIRGERFKDSKKDLKNNGDLYSLTQPGRSATFTGVFSKPARTSSRPTRFPPPASARANFSWTTRASTADARTRLLSGRHRKQISQRPGLGNQRAIRPAMPRMGDRIANQTGPAALRRRGHRAVDRFALQFAGCGRRRFSRLHFDQVKAAYVQSDSRADRGRLGHPAGGNHFRFAQRQGRAGGDPGSVRAGQKDPADHDFRRRGPRRRDHDFRADGGGVLERHEAREADCHRPELFARPGFDEAVSGGTGGEIRYGHFVLSQCRPAQSPVADRL
jgi:hypothetical protein